MNGSLLTVHQGGRAIVGNVQPGASASGMTGIDGPSPPALKQVPPGLTLDGLTAPKLAVVKAAYLSWVFVEAAVVGVLRLTGPGPGAGRR